MKEFSLFFGSFRGCLISAAAILVVTFAMVLSLNHQYPQDPACSGRLGAGFPVLFMCDNAGEGTSTGGGSPTSVWGKFTSDDVLHGGIQLKGFLVDLLFYTILFYVILFLILGFFHREAPFHTEV